MGAEGVSACVQETQTAIINIALKNKVIHWRFIFCPFSSDNY
jgi:hypothetical protein